MSLKFLSFTVAGNVNILFYKQKNSSNRYPIHYAIKSMCSENVEIFLKNYDPLKVNLKFGGQNCLHLLISAMTNTNYSDVSDCVKLLLSHGCSPNMPNNALKTPFYLLLKKQQEIEYANDLVEFFLENCEIDFQTYKGPEMIKMMQTQNPDHKLPVTMKVINYEFMMTLLDNRRELDFDIYFKAFKDTVGDDFTDNCLRFLEVAVANGMKDTVEFLLDKRVDVNARSTEAKYLKPPAFIAASSGYFRILELLVKKPELKFDYQTHKQKHTMLHEICQNFAMKAKDNQNVDFQKCFDLILKDQRCEPNAEDDLGCSPLHYTVRYKNDAATIALLKKGAYINEESNFGKTPIDEISHATFEKFLDECISTNVRSDKKIPDIQIDYNFLIAPNRNREIDSADKDGFCKEISSLKRISDNEELRGLVNHPVLSSFLFLKWSKLSFLFYTNLGVFSVFMAAFIAFIVLCQSQTVKEHETNLLYKALELISMVSIVILMVREFFQV
jgi:ankyrin repeat protein